MTKLNKAFESCGVKFAFKQTGFKAVPPLCTHIAQVYSDAPTIDAFFNYLELLLMKPFGVQREDHNKIDNGTVIEHINAIFTHPASLVKHAYDEIIKGNVCNAFIFAFLAAPLILVLAVAGLITRGIASAAEVIADHLCPSN